jgi:hypothetical protein
VTGSKAAASVGVKAPVSAVAPATAGTQEHFAANGVTVVVAAASQPTMATPLAMNFTVPALFAVAVIVIGASPKTPFPPEMINVEAFAA